MTSSSPAYNGTYRVAEYPGTPPPDAFVWSTSAEGVVTATGSCPVCAHDMTRTWRAVQPPLSKGWLRRKAEPLPAGTPYFTPCECTYPHPERPPHVPRGCGAQLRLVPAEEPGGTDR